MVRGKNKCGKNRRKKNEKNKMESNRGKYRQYEKIKAKQVA
jgi:hypothetical protein